MQNIDKKEFKGFSFAFIASIALANSFIFSKLLFNDLSFFQFGFWWFAVGSIWNLIYLLVFQSKQLRFGKFLHSLTSSLIIVALLEAVATGLFYYAILIMENPGVVSFIGNIGPVFVVVLGYFFLKESFSKIQFFGILLAISGIYTLNYKGYNTLNEIFIQGSQYVIAASFLFAIAAIVARKKHHKIDAGILSMIRALVLFLAFFLLFLYFDEDYELSLVSVIYIASGSFLEVFITIIFAYMSLKYIKAFKTSITISTKGGFALLSAWIFLGLNPNYYEILGGLLSLVGVILVSRNTEKE